MWPVARPGRELQLIMIIGPSGVQFSLQSYEYFQWQNRTTAKQEPDLSITRMITDRIGRHEFLLPINHNHYKFRKKKKTFRTNIFFKFGNFQFFFQGKWSLLVWLCDWRILLSGLRMIGCFNCPITGVRLQPTVLLQLYRVINDV